MFAISAAGKQISVGHTLKVVNVKVQGGYQNPAGFVGKTAVS